MSNPSVRIMSVRLKQMFNFDRNVLQQYRITPEHVNDATRAIYEAVNRSAKKLQDDLEDRAKAERRHRMSNERRISLEQKRKDKNMKG